MESPENQENQVVAEVTTPVVPTVATEQPEAAPAAVPALRTTGDVLSVYANADSFAHGQRIAKALSASTMIPKEYQGNIPNCLVALEMANRMNLSPAVVMQNLDIIHNRPSWKSTFIISSINTCGKFFGLRFAYSGENDNRSCYAYARSREDGEVISGPPISIATAKKQGWYGKNGSKWPDMPELMLSYRAATFFGRLYAPELLNGMPTVEETIDIGFDVVGSNSAALRKGQLNAKLSGKPAQPAVQYEATDAEVLDNDNNELGI
jgi:hypothetical protein